MIFNFFALIFLISVQSTENMSIRSDTDSTQRKQRPKTANMLIERPETKVQEIVNYIQENKNWANEKDTTGFSPLHMAVYHKRKDFLDQLLVSKAKVNPTNFYGDTPLMYACSVNQLTIAGKLLAAKANVQSKNKEGWTILHRATIKGNLKLVEKLIAKNAFLNAQNIFGKTPLHYAAEENQKSVALKLIHHKAILDVPTVLTDVTTTWPVYKDGSTALHIAVEFGSTEIVKTLIGAKSDINSKTTENQSAVTIAIHKKNEEIAKFLIDNDADVKHVLANKGTFTMEEWQWFEALQKNQQENNNEK